MRSDVIARHNARPPAALRNAAPYGGHGGGRGRGGTLRINGRARILRDAPFFDAMVVRGAKGVEAPGTPLEEHYGPRYAERLYG
ncbi:hypothetical protein ACH4OW_35845 [Streptomyces sp. NPDC017056]|uniref:hypothetical protein n=1 Tax=Streptomyces sp. NPDC017056 TaxID=3364973 RepID=UPI00378ED1D3